VDKPAPDPPPQKLQEHVSHEPQREASQKVPASWLRDNVEKVVIPVIIAVLTAIILAWLGLKQ
jgi:hypothetical protein